MEDNEEVQSRLEALSALAAAQLESGRVTSDVVKTIESCGRTIGLTPIDTINLGQAVVITHSPPDGTSVSHQQKFKVTTAIDCERVRRLHLVALEISEGKIPAREVVPLLEKEVSQELPWYSSLLSTLGLALLAACITVQAGAGPQAAFFVAILEIIVGRLGVLLNWLNISQLFVTAGQGVAAGSLSLWVASSGYVSWVSCVAALAVTLVVLIPQSSLVTCVQDAVDGEYLGALVRGALVLACSIGVVVAASATISMGSHIVPSHVGARELPTLAPLISIGFAAIGGMGNALANGGGLRLVVPAACVGMAANSINLFTMRYLESNQVVAAGTSAVALGILAALFARPVGYPAYVLVLMGITGGLLPGLAVFVGISAQFRNQSGWGHLGEAATICSVIGIGAALGSTLVNICYKAIQRDSGVASPY